MDHTRSAPRPRGKVFVSYRQFDGTPAATNVAWTLRAVGLPVWHDATDLPPGDTTRLIKLALASGVSGAVLVVTDDISNSPVVKNIEWPLIRALAANGSFTLGVVNAVKTVKDDIYGAPDRLLRRRSDRILGRFRHHIKGLKQYRYVEASDRTESLAADMLRQRLGHLEGEILEHGYVSVDLATRADPHAEHAESADLTFRWTREAADPRLHPRATLQRTFHIAATALREHANNTIRFRGQTHLSFGLAIGASLTLGPTIEFENDDGLWQITPTGSSTGSRITHTAVDARAGSGPILVYVDLLFPDSDAAYLALALSDTWTEVVHLKRLDKAERIRAEDGEKLAREIANEIRAASARNGNAAVHLLFYGPLPIALLTGTLLNTLDVTVYEWHRSADDEPAGYLPAFTLQPGEQNSIVAAW